MFAGAEYDVLADGCDGGDILISASKWCLQTVSSMVERVCDPVGSP